MVDLEPTLGCALDSTLVSYLGTIQSPCLTYQHVLNENLRIWRYPKLTGRT